MSSDHQITRLGHLPILHTTWQDPLGHGVLALLEALERAWENGRCYHPIRRGYPMPSLN
jgi:hypothetical protein